MNKLSEDFLKIMEKSKKETKEKSKKKVQPIKKRNRNNIPEGETDEELFE